MKNLLNFFFSFDKLFKEKLIAPAFWLALIFYALVFLRATIDAVHLDPLNWIIAPLTAVAGFFFTLLLVRIVAELAVAVFRINDNLSPDKGRSELVDIDPVAEARRAAEAAAARTRELAGTATERTKATFDDVKTSVEDRTENLTGSISSRAKNASQSIKSAAGDAAQSARERTESVMGKGSVPRPGDEPTPVKILEPSAADAPRKRGRPKGSKNKPKPTTASAAAPVAKRGPGRPKGSKNKSTTAAAKSSTAKSSAAKSSASKSSTATAKRGPGRPKGSTNKPKATAARTPAAKSATGAKRGPKPGTKIPRDEFGNLLKKDGTPRKKPGPKPK